MTPPVWKRGKRRRRLSRRPSGTPSLGVDAATGQFRTVYAGEMLGARLVELLAGFRADPAVVASCHSASIAWR